MRSGSTPRACRRRMHLWRCRSFACWNRPIGSRSRSWIPIVRIGIDLGGTKIEIAAIDAEGIERYRRRIPAPRDSYDATVDAIAQLVRDAEAVVGTATVGI